MSDTVYKHAHLVRPGDIVLEPYAVTYVVKNLDSWDGGCCLEGIDLLNGVTTTDWFAAFDTLEVLA